VAAVTDPEVRALLISLGAAIARAHGITRDDVELKA
jgi:hypothetical protein